MRASLDRATRRILDPVFTSCASRPLSEVYGGGGNTGATYQNDFIELYNNSDVPVDVSTWSVQYASAAGSSWTTTPLTGSIQPKSFYLVAESSNAAVGAVLPRPNATG